MLSFLTSNHSFHLTTKITIEANVIHYPNMQTKIFGPEIFVIKFLNFSDIKNLMFLVRLNKKLKTTLKKCILLPTTQRHLLKLT